MKIALLKGLDRVIGCLVARLLPPPGRQSRSIGPVKQILIIRPGGIGDAVHLVPSIKVLLDRLPHLAIDVLAEHRNAGAFSLCQGIGHVYYYDRPAQLLRVLRNRYDVVIDTEQWHRLSAVVARLVNSPVKVGFATNERARLFTQTLPYSHDDYEADSFLRLLEPLGITSKGWPDEPWLEVPESVRRAVAERLPPVAAKGRVVIFPGASIAERRWGADRFREVSRWCLESHLQVVVVGGKADVAEAGLVASGLPVVNLAGSTTLAETAAVLDSAAVVVSGDSGVLHLAVGLGRATVSMFGPGIARKWAPRGHRHIVLNRHSSCSPCTRFGYTPPCSNGVVCMNEITVDNVTDAINALLEPARGPE